MKIIICIKQVPEISGIKIENGKVVPPGTGILNPFDAYAIEEGLRLKERFNGMLIALSLGDSTAEFALREALALGVDQAVMLVDPRFAGSDPMATARILAAGIKKLGDFDLILCGKQAIDDDTSLVPPAIAAFLDLPQVTFVKKIEKLAGNQITVHRMTEDGYDLVETRTPVLLSVVKEINEPRLPSLKGKMKAKSAPVTRYSASDLDLTADQIGESGSPTKITRVSLPQPRPKGEIIEGTPEEIAEKLFSKLREAQVI